MTFLDRRSLLISSLAGVMLASCRGETGRKLTVGWQTPLATQGEIAAILQKSDVLEKHGLAAGFAAFSFGSPQMEAARAGTLDVALVGDQPLLNLICSGADWKILCRLFDTRTALYRRKDKPWTGARGATFAAPKGSVADRETYYYLKGLGLDPARDARTVAIDATEISALLQRPDWGDIDVVGIWEPLATQLEDLPEITRLFDRKTLGVVGVAPEIARDPDLVARLRAAVQDAWRYFLAHEQGAHQWYRELASSKLSDTVLRRTARIDRSFASGAPDIGLTAQDRAELARSMAWANVFNPALKPRPVEQIVIA